VMNAGAYGGEIKDILEYADVLDESGNILRLKNEDLGFGYRKSIIQEKNYIVLMVSFLLKRGDEKTIKAEMRELNERRREKQPLEYPSAGSTFKRPEGLFAGKLIEDSGLKGYRVGDAQVSEKHCGFVVNRGKATSSDIYKLIGDVIGIVYEKTGVQLDPEIKLLGFEE
ncbi:MAG: UDP-N-acetylmuramate dehydrogenase, partial [Lachnospiraceae bacterium]|nr:UDP-N-acetylmuramate dehydrogenase [Lachnospiraceae bacterium]